jgi:hypothetical protein
MVELASGRHQPTPFKVIETSRRLCVPQLLKTARVNASTKMLMRYCSGTYLWIVGDVEEVLGPAAEGLFGLGAE